MDNPNLNLIYFLNEKRKLISELWQTCAYLSDNLISNGISDFWPNLCEVDLR